MYANSKRGDLDTNCNWIGFWELWNSPNCVDGKDIKIPAPRNSGSLFFFFFFKQTFSIVLLGVVDAKYRFVAAVIGSFGKKSDGGIFSSSQLGQRLENNTLNIPPETMYAAWYN